MSELLGGPNVAPFHARDSPGAPPAAHFSRRKSAPTWISNAHHPPQNCFKWEGKWNCISKEKAEKRGSAGITADPTSVSAVDPLLDVISLASDSRGLCSAKMGGKVGQRMPLRQGNKALPAAQTQSLIYELNAVAFCKFLQCALQQASITITNIRVSIVWLIRG